MSQHIELTLAETDAAASIIQLLRRHTTKTISDLRESIQSRRPFIDESPHHNDYDAFISRIMPLLDELDAKDIEYSVRIDGRDEPSVYLRNVFQRWKEISEETKYLTDLEIGEPCIETLEWLKATSPKSVFRSTIEQVVNGDGFDCDAATKEWAKRQLSSDQ